jgi:hypothetical protein
MAPSTLIAWANKPRGAMDATPIARCAGFPANTGPGTTNPSGLVRCPAT